MKELTDALHYEDFFATVVALVLLWFIAHFFSGEPKVQRWSVRIAAAALLGHAALQFADSPPETAADLVPILVRAIITGVFALALGTIALSVFVSIETSLIEPIRRRSRDARHARRRASEDRRQERMAEEARRRAQKDWEASAPERERARLEAEERSRVARSDQKRRDNARLECESLYALHAPELIGRFPRAEFEQFLRKSMPDSLSPAEVEDRGQQLKRVIQQHVDKVQPPPRFKSLEELATWFQVQQQQAASIADERQRRVIVAQLNERYAELTSRFLEELQS